MLVAAADNDKTPRNGEGLILLILRLGDFLEGIVGDVEFMVVVGSLIGRIEGIDAF